MSQITTVALGVEYIGQHYSGWQAQRDPKLRTIQGMLEPALAFVADHPVKLICAGRTDTGVHGFGQVASFETASKRPLKAWIQGVNCRLPDDISIVWAKYVDNDFHARFSATARRYQYFILNRDARSAIASGRFTQVRDHLDAVLMNEAAQSLLGEHDFSAFRGAGCQSKSAVREISHIHVMREQDFVRLDIKANAFLLHMVRNIVGSLLAVGTKEQPVSWIGELLRGRDRTVAGVTAPPNGLYLASVDYPAKFDLPVARNAAIISSLW